MPVTKLCKALVAFADGSFLFVELSRMIEPGDNSLFCAAITGLPDGTPTDKPTIATSIFRLAQAGEAQETIIPMNRINGVGIIEELIKKDIAKDVEALWAEVPQK